MIVLESPLLSRGDDEPGPFIAGSVACVRPRERVRWRMHNGPWAAAEFRPFRLNPVPAPDLVLLGRSGPI